MSEDEKAKVVVQRSDQQTEWPEQVSRRLSYLMELAHQHHFSLIAGIGLHHEHKRLSVMLSPTASENPHLPEMLDDIAETFTLMAKRFRQ